MLFYIWHEKISLGGSLMSKKILKYIFDIITLCSIGFVLYLGYFIFFDKPTNPQEITTLYSKMSYAFLVLFVVLIVRVVLKKSKGTSS